MDVSQLKCRPRFEEMEQLKSHLRAGPAAQISAFISHIYVRLLSCVISVIDCRHCRRCPQLFYSNSLLSAYMSCILLVQFNYQAWHSFWGRCTHWPTVWFTWTPRDQSFPAQPISTHNAQSRKKAHKPLRTPWISQKKCLPYLTIIQSCYFDYRMNQDFAFPRCVICVSCFRFTWISTFYARKGSWAFLDRNYPQINEVRKPDHMTKNGALSKEEYTVHNSLAGSQRSGHQCSTGNLQ